MRTRIVPLGNVQAVLLPPRVLKQAGLSGEVEVRLEGSVLVILATPTPRSGWAAAFQKLADAALLIPDVPSLTSWDEREWEWQ